MPLGMRQPMANVRNAQYTLLRQRAFLSQVVHQTTHSLARFFLEVDANYKLFKTAGRNRAYAAARLNVQQAQYEVGKVAIDRYLDSVSQWANAVALEAQYKTSYNTSIVALEEAKGTLLAYDNIAVSEGPHPAKAYVQAKDQQQGHRVLPLPGDGFYKPTQGAGNVIPDPVSPMPPPNADPNPVRPPMPYPGGTIGPVPPLFPPAAPAGGGSIMTSNPPKPTDPSTRPLFESMVKPASATAPAGNSINAGSSEAGSDDLPPLPAGNNP